MADPIPTSYAMDNGHLRHSLRLLVSNQSERSKSLYMQLVMDKGLRVLRVCGFYGFAGMGLTSTGAGWIILTRSKPVPVTAGVRV
jgi:hypothetical protein